MLTRTTTALLDDLHDPRNETVWQEFVERCRPVLLAFGRRLGLDHEDAADAAQDSLVSFVRAYRAGRYDRTRGRLSSWLFGIARHCIADVRQERARRPQRGLSAVEQAPGDDEHARIWNEECDREILRRAFEQLRAASNRDPRTVRAFELVALENRPVQAVADELDMTPNDVYLAKHRCLKQMRMLVAETTALLELHQET
jgi:RNA polymerase sigma factor (sigma-70 family)